MRLTFFLIIGLFLQVTCQSQETIGREPVIAKLRDIRATVQAVANPDSNVIQKRNNLRLLISDVIIRVGAFEGEFPEAYASSLDKLIKASKLISALKSEEQIKLMGLIHNDLSIKFKNRSNTLGAELFGDLLRVTVSCSRKGVIVNNLRVHYAALGYQVNPSKPDGSFPILTSPANDKIVPGYYMIWVTEDGSFSVLRSWSGEISPERENAIQLDLP